ncbi:MAG: DUF1343 domain-containing protein [Deltaproteobacteria bacterium]|nr:MAG: DUF1343 domain-containing protein [Deltaproteobacteria bacterium]
MAAPKRHASGRARRAVRAGAVRTGLEVLLADDARGLRGRRVGLLANPTAVDGRFRHAVDALAACGVDLRALFGPEHGLRGDAQDMVPVDGAVDARTGLPVYSLYGPTEASLEPTGEQLAGIDVLVYDIQDVGARYYTYVWTLVCAMRACARAGVAVVVLDRPNPLGGVEVEGGAVADGYRSFVGMASIPNRHGLTAGELARWANEVEGIGCELEVVRMEGWRRELHYPDTGLAWVMPSPNMPTYDTALVYPGMCLIEGTELSEGRGTTRPFEIVGAPFVDGYALADALADLPGVVARPLVFTPTFHKHAGARCGGVQLHVTDRDAFRPYLTGVAVLRAVRHLWPDQFAWRRRPYEFVADRPAIDLLTGGPEIRTLIDAGASLDDLAATWRGAEVAFRAARGACLLYD